MTPVRYHVVGYMRLDLRHEKWKDCCPVDGTRFTEAHRGSWNHRVISSHFCALPDGIVRTT